MKAKRSVLLVAAVVGVMLAGVAPASGIPSPHAQTVEGSSRPVRAADPEPVDVVPLRSLGVAPSQHAGFRAVPFMETPGMDVLPTPSSTAATVGLASSYTSLGALDTPLAPSPEVTTGFAGASYTNQYPPDTDGAVGPNHVVDMVNGQFKVHSRNGDVLLSMPLDAFWGVASTFDPRVLYDADADRWIAISAAAPWLPTSSLLIAASATSDPTGSWNGWQIDVDSGDVGWADYPQVGFDANVVVISASIYATFDGMFIKPLILAFDKSDLYAGDPPNAVWWQSLDPQTWGASLAPSVPYDSGWTDVYLLETLAGDYLGSGYLLAARFSGTIDTPVLDLLGTVSVADPWADQWFFTGPQLGSTTGIDTGDARMGQVVIRDGSMWAAHTVGLPAALPTHSAVQWWNIATNGEILQRGRIDDSSAETSYAFPSIAVNAEEDVLIGFAEFAASHYAAGAYAFRSDADPPGTMREPIVFKMGVAPYVRLDGGGRNRWGDYSSTVVDPTNDLDFWTVQEYVPNADNEWGTWWANVVPPVARLAGLSRFGTAAGVSKVAFPSGASTVFVANGLNFPDALAGGVAAALAPGPVLLVTPDTIPSETVDELVRLAPDEIVILGGTGAVSASVETGLGAYASSVRRLAGADRFATAVAVAEDSFPSGAGVVVVTNGLNYPDALAGVPAAAKLGGPLLLVAPTSLPTVTADEIVALGASRVVILGGTGAVSADVETALAGLSGVTQVDRWAGVSRFGTAAAISQEVWPSGADVVYVAYGLNFPDALAGGPAAFLDDGPLLLVNLDSIPTETADEIIRLGASRVVILGGAGVVSDTVAAQLDALVGS